MRARHIPPVKQVRRFMDEISPKGGLERLAQKDDLLEKLAPEIDKLASSDKEADLARSAVRKLARDEDLDADHRIAHEAIIMPQLRPVIDIEHDSYATPAGQWKHLGRKKIRERIEAAIPSVGRVELPDDPNTPYVGTGFVVGPDLLMTNRHVAEAFCSGLGVNGIRFTPGRSVGMDFREEVVESDSIYVAVRDVEMVHPYWDMALLRVEGLPEEQVSLALSLEHPSDLGEREIAVIGYPAFDSRNDAAMQNRIFRGVYNVKRLQPGTLAGRRTITSFENFVSALRHNASTLGGNSGSAIIDLGTGEVVGLHFAGAYMDANYAVPSFELARDQRVVDAGLVFGGRPPGGQPPWDPRWLAADPQEVVTPADSTSRPASAAAVPGGGPEPVTWTIPLQVTVSIGTPTGGAPAPGLTVAAAEVEKTGTIPDPDYSTREGYDEDFLPGHGVRIPWLTDDQYALTARPSLPGFSRHVLPYHHYSLVMNRVRRIAFFTAANIDGARYDHVIRADFRDEWSLDPRVEEAVQMDNEHYRDFEGVHNPLDRGHLVRRLDPCWGDTRAEVLAAHHDTFHYTNCAPQHLGFNRYDTFWGGMEDHILNNANAQNQRVTVFTGPVLRDDDPVYMAPTGAQVQIPLTYWKVVAWVREDGTLAAAGYLLSQEGHVGDMLEVVEFGVYREFQVAIGVIEEAAGLEFKDLAGCDVFGGDEEAVAGGRREQRSLEDVVL